MPPFDPSEIRADFPILGAEVNGRPLIYLDNAATSQKPRQVLVAMDRFIGRKTGTSTAVCII